MSHTSLLLNFRKISSLSPKHWGWGGEGGVHTQKVVPEWCKTSVSLLLLGLSQKEIRNFF